MGPKATRINFGLPTSIILVCLAWLVILAQGCGTVRAPRPGRPASWGEIYYGSYGELKGNATSTPGLDCAEIG